MTTYSYDRENRLISQNVDGNVTSFAYDGFGRKRRESRGVNPDVILNWDGDQMIVESSDLDPEAPSKAYYVADGVIYAENANLGSEKSRRDYAVDFLGSVTGLTDSDASLSSVRRWSAYGKLLSGSAEPIGYFWTGNTGSRVYQSLGLNDNRARHYGRNIKQWITRDPLWPSELPYAYVSGNPVTRIDPSGKFWQIAACVGCSACLVNLAIVCSDCGTDLGCWASCMGGVISELPPWAQVLCGGTCAACLAALIMKIKKPVPGPVPPPTLPVGPRIPKVPPCSPVWNCAAATAAAIASLSFFPTKSSCLNAVGTWCTTYGAAISPACSDICSKQAILFCLTKPI
jgi:RHS repeat-associated protein